jgi:hypothetical protein
MEPSRHETALNGLPDQWLRNQLRSRALRRYGRRTSRPSSPRRSQLTVLAASSPGVGRLALTYRSRGSGCVFLEVFLTASPSVGIQLIEAAAPKKGLTLA